MVPQRPPVLVLAGPTGAGKSALGVAVATAFDAVVVSADAVAVYAGLDIGSAKPTRAERGGVPHFGFDQVLPDEPFDAADFVALLDAVRARHPRVVVVGGTHFYLRAMVGGLWAAPAIPGALRRAVLDEPDLAGWVERVDPELRARVGPSDRVRLARGLEVFLATGRPLTAWHEAHRRSVVAEPIAALWIDRDDLDDRIERRVGAMWEAGLVDEVRGLLDAGFARELKPMRSLGYRHVADALAGDGDLDAARRALAQDTRRSARKQRTWNGTLGFPVHRQDHLGAAVAAARALGWG